MSTSSGWLCPPQLRTKGSDKRGAGEGWCLITCGDASWVLLRCHPSGEAATAWC